MGNPTLDSLNQKDVWQTPEWLTNGIAEAIGGFDLDPCAGPETRIADTNWSIQRGEDHDERGSSQSTPNVEFGVDGLDRDWFGDVWVNPPFSEKEDWLREATFQHGFPDEGPDRVFVLTPDSTDVKSWFHGYCTMADYVWFSKGRVKFIDPKTGEPAGSPSFGTAISVFGEIEPPLREWFHSKGWLTKTASRVASDKRRYNITD